MILMLALTTVLPAIPSEATMRPDPAHGVDQPANRLIDETSPYLLQHAYNPVDWYPWGEVAFQKAREENKPIFLSVGYSTCYWCHVMERESFEDPKVAEFMNQHFVNIKVDREERPDVDDVYMTAVQMMTGRGGWPMSVFLEPDTLKPFYGGTYFPPDDRGGMPSFLTVASRLSEAWSIQQDPVRLQASRIADAVAAQLADRPAAVPVGRDDVDKAVSQLLSRYDEQDAGYGGAPKFPMPVTLDFLMETGWDLPTVKASLLHTLDRMAMGGMYDQVGGGFHRYSTDEKWLVPHFEKMLYDNGMLATVYATACERTGDSYYCEIAKEILEYTLREMVAEGGGFYSAQDAESNAREGESYLWTPEEVVDVLVEGGMDEADIKIILNAYGLDQGPNFQDPHHPEEPPSNVIHLVARPEVLAAEHGLEIDAFRGRLKQANALLLARRDHRDQPLTDDKIIVAWNGLMIAGMADTGRLLGSARYVEAAGKAADWIREHMWSPEAGLMRTARADQVKIAGFLEDYALLIRGLLSLYEATQDRAWLDFAEQLLNQAKARFWDESVGGWYDTRDDQTDLFVRGRSLYDGALPCGSGTMLMNLVRWRAITDLDHWDDDIRAALGSASSFIEQSPTSSSKSTQALARLLRDHPSLLEQGARPGIVEAGRVRVAVEPSEVTMAANQSIEVMLMVEIEEGWHLTAPGQADPFAIGMSIASLTDGLQVDAKWPESHPFKGPEGDLTVYSGSIQISLTLTSDKMLEEDARIMLSWQACNEQICDRPQSERIPLVIRRMEAK